MDDYDRELLSEWGRLENRILAMVKHAMDNADDITPAFTTVANVAAQLIHDNSIDSESMRRQLRAFAGEVSTTAHRRFLARTEAEQDL